MCSQFRHNSTHVMCERPPRAEVKDYRRAPDRAPFYGHSGALQMSAFAFFNEVKESKHEEPLIISKGFLFPSTSILRTLPHLKGTIPRRSKHTRKQNAAA